MKVLIALSLILLIVNATMVVEKRIITKNIIQQLSKSRFGKNVFTAIQLELSSKNTDNIVNRILQLLHELDETLRKQFEQTSDDLQAKQDWCKTELDSLKEQLESKKEKLEALNIQIPTLQSQLSEKKEELQSEKDSESRAVQLLRELLEQDSEGKHAYELQRDHINNMAEALKEARRLISQLQRGTFLQKSGNVLAELKAHHTSFSKILSPSNKQIFNILMNMSQNVDILADQVKVNTVITIIDDLLAHQIETLQFLENSEKQRQNEVSEKKQNFELQRDNAHANILKITSEISNLQSNHNQATHDKEVISEDLRILQERLESTFNACNDSINNLSKELENLSEEVSIVKQVIEIFESHPIQDIKPTQKINMFVDYSNSESESEINKQNHKQKINPDVSTLKLQEEQNQLKNKQLQELKQIEQQLTRPHHTSGKVDICHINSYSFDQQFYNFKNRGYAYDPTTEENRLIVNDSKFPELAQKIFHGQSIDPTHLDNQGVFVSQSKEEKVRSKDLKKKRFKSGTVTNGNYQGPWANYEGEVIKQPELTQEEKLKLETKEIENKKQKEEQQRNKEKENSETEDNEDSKKTKKAQKNKNDATSIFHDAIPFYDYKGRSFVHPPVDLKQREHMCYIPKKQVHCWTGHTKGVQAIRFFPKFGHLLLSASLDTTVKLWDVINNKKCVRTYMGHNQAVRDIEFTNDGLHFLSCSYDKNVIYWDTETGKAIKTFNIKKFPYQARFNPEQSKQHAFLLASSNKKISQYDVRSGNRTQVYDEHLGAVNTVTFIDAGRKFVSSSDDKKVFLWEFGIPVVIKHLAEPDMRAITNTVIHPQEKFFAGQCSDNKVQIYDTKGGNFRLNRKKVFQGHSSLGYAIGIDFSPDGQFLASGDAEGRAFFWDWKTCKNYRVIQAHDGVCIDVRWHPIEQSKVATCGWDGLIKYWD
ncbi:hypothetical protein IMG5_118640 [Ichthyophthirius multifiliis]|uniref:Pre-mRNA-processing factor 17 n=1 Tax=Ichthyophthirius multifiliis TaxID=5932 RepID=G0QUQ4_ICHMU|nr:hypothetical protein IMG5_118640 [Ichthyophthirius multifiliis]EGR31039.1 hypothetical protein IMG5_118640 [Ichthyophthirius multifiliis]|eukprot:XP_004034525.1 hypothetical protein IMG5_118640 [Ichthyophthirius multifiliis]